jgi:hypothetical protein
MNQKCEYCGNESVGNGYLMSPSGDLIKKRICGNCANILTKESLNVGISVVVGVKGVAKSIITPEMQHSQN